MNQFLDFEEMEDSNDNLDVPDDVAQFLLSPPESPPESWRPILGTDTFNLVPPVFYVTFPRGDQPGANGRFTTSPAT